MRILHSADWRLGRAFHGTSLLAEQAAFVEQLVALVRSSRAEAVVLAGGLLEPGAGEDARALLEHALARLALDEGVAVVALVEGTEPVVGRGLLARLGVHLLGEDVDPARPVELKTAGGRVRVHGLPDRGGWESFSAGLDRARSAPREEGPRLLLARVPPGEPAVAETWEDFDACLLGGRRRAREVVPGRAWQAGAPMPEGFDDAGHERGLGLVVLGADGGPRHERLSLPGEPGLRVLSGSLAELLAIEPTMARVRAEPSDPGLAVGLGRLRRSWPGLLELSRPAPGGPAPPLASLVLAHLGAVEAEPQPSALDVELLAEALGGRGA